MIDSSDGDSFWMFSLIFKGPAVIMIMLGIAGVLWVVASQNEAECKQQLCPANMTARLQNHECQCVMPAGARVIPLAETNREADSDQADSDQADSDQADSDFDVRFIPLADQADMK